VRNAQIPILKFKIFNIHIDLSHASTSQKSLENIDEELDKTPCLQTSLSGYYANKLIFESVYNQRRFSKVLTFIKLWAKQKQIHSHIMGYFSGISLAIMVAYLMNNNKDLTAYEVILKFFKFYYYKLKDTVVLSETCKKDIPIVKRTIQVLSPVVPNRNTCSNVCGNTKQIIMQLITETAELCAHKSDELITKHNCAFQWETDNDRSIILKSLLEPIPLMTLYDYYIQIDVLSGMTVFEKHVKGDHNTMTHDEILRYCEVRLGSLVKLFEKHNMVALSKCNYSYYIHQNQVVYEGIEDSPSINSMKRQFAWNDDYNNRSTLFFGVYVHYDRNLTRPKDPYPTSKIIKLNVKTVINLFKRRFKKLHYDDIKDQG
jgi:hypothetical protein